MKIMNELEQKKTVKLISCKDAIDANYVKGLLEDEGISCMMSNENMSSLYPGQMITFAEVDVLVFEDTLQAARAVLKENHLLEEHLNACPACGSTNIRFSTRRSRTLAGIFSTIASLFTASPLQANTGEYECRECKEKFAVPTAEKNEEEK